MDTKKQKILDLIVKLKSLSENNPSVEESALASARMQALISEYQISQAEIEETETPEDQEDFTSTVAHTEAGPNVITWKLHLIGAIARNNMCRYSYRKGSAISKASYTVYGKPSNIQVVQYMFSFLTKEIESLTRDEMARQRYAGRKPGKSYSNSFKLGAVDTISRRMQEAKKERFDAACSTTAMVRVETDERELQRWIRGSFNLRSANRTANNSNGTAYSRGREAGHSIGLGSGKALGAGPLSLK